MSRTRPNHWRFHHHILRRLLHPRNHHRRSVSDTRRFRWKRSQQRNRRHCIRTSESRRFFLPYPTLSFSFQGCKSSNLQGKLEISRKNVIVKRGRTSSLWIHPLPTYFDTNSRADNSLAGQWCRLLEGIPLNNCSDKVNRCVHRLESKSLETRWSWRRCCSGLAWC